MPAAYFCAISCHGQVWSDQITAQQSSPLQKRPTLRRGQIRIPDYCYIDRPLKMPGIATEMSDCIMNTLAAFADLHRRPEGCTETNTRTRSKLAFS